MIFVWLVTLIVWLVIFDIVKVLFSIVPLQVVDLYLYPVLGTISYLSIPFKVDNFILEKNKEGKEVYILDATAAIYMIPIDRYNKDYDMFLKGNLGAKGEEGQIEKLENETNTVILIMNENYRRNWQNPENVREYIINNWTKTGQIENFEIYEKGI